MISEIAAIRTSVVSGMEDKMKQIESAVKKEVNAVETTARNAEKSVSEKVCSISNASYKLFVSTTVGFKLTFRAR